MMDKRILDDGDGRCKDCGCGLDRHTEWTGVVRCENHNTSCAAALDLNFGNSADAVRDRLAAMGCGGD